MDVDTDGRRRGGGGDSKQEFGAGSGVSGYGKFPLDDFAGVGDDSARCMWFLNDDAGGGACNVSRGSFDCYCIQELDTLRKTFVSNLAHL